MSMCTEQNGLEPSFKLDPLVPLLPNRVRRNYRGGYLLDKLDGNPAPCDGNKPEDWLASTVPAVNPGMSPVPDEGLSHVQMPSGKICRLDDLFKMAPAYHLGSDPAGSNDLQLGFLAKLLDSSMRLHVQAHPTTAFARKHLHSPWGKLETYVILGLRDEKSSYIRLGFQRPPSPQEWRRIVLEQDIAAMDACFDRIPIQLGEVWLVPGGLPHAIGEGVLMLEVMEPSDLVVRCEFEREGIVIPPEARFMQTSVDLAMQVFDYTPLTAAQAKATYCLTPQRLSPHEELLVGPAHTDRFSISRFMTHDSMDLPPNGRARLGLVAGGRGTLTLGDREISLKKGFRFLLAASAPGGKVTAHGGEVLEILFCNPRRRI